MPSTLTNGEIPNGSVLMREGRRIVGLSVADGPSQFIPVADSDGTSFQTSPASDGLGQVVSLVRLDADSRRPEEILLSIEALAVRLVFMLEAHLNGGESTKEITKEHIS